MFTYVSGNALNQKDSLGLSPEDVRKIQNKFNQVVKDMTSKGERLNIYFLNNALSYNRDDDNGYWPKAVAGTLSGIFSNGQSTLICGQQWERVQGELNNLDDKGKLTLYMNLDINMELEHQIIPMIQNL